MAAKESLKRIFSLLFLIFSIVLVIVIVRTFTLAPRKISAPECKPYDTDFIKADRDVVQRFQQALQFQTISYSPHVYNRDELVKLREFIIKCKATWFLLLLHVNFVLDSVFLIKK